MSWEVLTALLVRAEVRDIVINGREEEAARLVPGTAKDGLMVSAGAIGQNESFLREIPQARTLKVSGREGPLTYAFFRMSVND